MASFEQRGDSIRVVVRLPGGGKRTATFDTMTQAQAWAREAERRKSIGQLTSAGGTTCGQAWEAFLDARGSKTDSARFNRYRIMGWMGDPLAAKKLSETTPADIDDWIDRRLAMVNARTGLPITAATVTREFNIMSAAFTWAVKSKRWIATNPCHDARHLGKAKPRRRPLLTQEEIQALCIATNVFKDPELRTLTAKVGTCFLLALETGMRSGEMLRLRKTDYFRYRRIVHVAAIEPGGRKTSRSGRIEASRDVPLTARAMDLLDKLLKAAPEGPYIVGMTDGQRDAIWRKARDQAGVQELHFHDTKHEAATRLARHLGVLALSHALGTKDIRLLRDMYYNNDAQRAAELLPPRLSLVA